jgi:hypothetical protein
MKTLVATLCATLVASQASAQSEAALKEYFEGKTVVVKMDMPATQTGVDVFADARRPINFDEYSARLKSAGIALKNGDSVMITKIRVKDKIIEFQLGGGGYGTFGDDTSTSVSVPSESKSTREKDLERDIKNETDPARKKRMQTELDDLRRAREREDRRNQAAATAASEEKKARLADQRLHAGSRFNIRYQDGVPPGVTPGGIMAALADYVEFPFTDKVMRPGVKADPPVVQGGMRTTMAGKGAVYKGMTWQQAQDSLGSPEKTSDRMEGKLKVTTAIFSRDDQRIEAEFVEGVLIRYSISSK